MIPDEREAVRERRPVPRERRHEKRLLPVARADEEHPVLHRPLRMVRVLPQKQRVKRAVRPLVMMLAEKRIDILLLVDRK